MGNAAHPHHLERIDLLGDLHGADLGGDVGPHLARQDDRDDGRGELEDHGLAHREADGVGGNPTADLVGRLDGDDRPHEQAQQGHDAHTLDANGLEFHKGRLGKHPALLGPAHGRGEEGEIASDVVEDAHASQTKVRCGRALRIVKPPGDGHQWEAPGPPDV